MRRPPQLLFHAALALAATSSAFAAEYHGQVVFNGLPVPGATVTITEAGKTYSTTTDRQGFYFFADLPAGAATLTVDMFCFAPSRQDITLLAENTAPAPLELKLLPLSEIQADLQAPPPPLPPVPVLQARETPKPNAPKQEEKGPEPTQEELSARAADGLLINGSVNNAATSKFTISPAFGNNRPGVGGLYNGSLGFQEDNSTFDARPYSLSGLATPRPSYNRFSAAFNIGGPIRLPHRRFTHEPNFFAQYAFSRNRNDTDASALVPDLNERAGNFSQETLAGHPITVFNPATGQPYANDTVPITPQAAALLALYPLPNVAGNALYNLQVPLLSTQDSDSFQFHLQQPINPKNQLFGDFALQSSRSTSPNLFGFTDTNHSLGLNTNINYYHRFNQRISSTLTYRFSRFAAQVTPYWENLANISGASGITGNAQDPFDWGPPTLDFTSGIVPLTDAVAVHNRNQTNALALSNQYNRRRHNVTLGGDFRRLEFNYLQQANPRGTFSFTGAATGSAGATATTTGSDLADFLIGVPDTSTVNFGNADKYFRQNTYDAYLTDDFRISSTFTLNAGIRWEYGSPIVETENRLVNLDQANNFATVAPVIASTPVGPVSGQHFPTSLLRPDRVLFEPRVGLSWRPIPGSSVVVRAGYGAYADTSVYQSTYFQLAQQSPLSKSLSVQNSATCQLTLANGFHTCGTTIPNTFAADPNFRVGYAQTWNLSVQRDLPAALQATVTYLGVKGTRGNQEFLPNTGPVGSAVSTAPLGFIYLTSNGNSTREAGSLQLRRRLRNGLTASLLYTYSKSIDDDAALGGQGPVAAGIGTSAASPNALAIAQNWQNLAGERGLSSFDQRHVLNATAQYTSGQGIGGGSLMSGKRGVLLKEWTLATSIVTATGLPENPVYPFAVPGTGFIGSLRPNRTAANLYNAPAGFHLNAAAFAAPAAGTFGNARRNSIEGPDQFSLNGSVARTFRYKKRYSLDFRIDATNLLNHVTFTSYVSTLNNTQFGLPVGANPQRSLQTSARLRF